MLNQNTRLALAEIIGVCGEGEESGNRKHYDTITRLLERCEAHDEIADLKKMALNGKSMSRATFGYPFIAALAQQLLDEGQAA